ncbi:MAG: hypothetical protein GZ087_00875 [Flavobacterium sp.]|nr:hypothetical protein [Flavobacterium sp.]
MEVLIYQIVIVILILAAGAFGKKARNVVTIIICLFTIIEVFTFKLAVLQFITMFIAYFFSIGYEEKKVEVKKEEFNYQVVDKKVKEKIEKNKQKSKSSFSGFSIFFIIIISIFSTIYIFQKKNETNKELLEIKKDTVVYNEGKKLFDPAQDVIANEVPSENNDIGDKIREEDYLSNKNDFIDYYKDVKNGVEYCDHKDLSYEYDYTIFLKKDVNQKIDKIIVQIRNKTTKEILEKDISLIDIDGVSNDYFDSTFTNCNLVRSFITGHNVDKKPYDLDEGDFIVGDFNFDNNEDFAIKIQSGNNSGPLYGFYIKRGNGYELDSFLTNEVRYLPYEVNNISKTIKTNIIIGCCRERESVYKYSSTSKRWVTIMSEDKDMN